MYNNNNFQLYDHQQQVQQPITFEPTNLPTMQSFLKPVNTGSLDSPSPYWDPVAIGPGFGFDPTDEVLQSPSSPMLGSFQLPWDYNNNKREDLLCMDSSGQDGKDGIDRACMNMNIPKDPQLFRMDDVLLWLRYQMRQYHFSPGQINEHEWMVDGEGFCQMTLNDFKARLPQAADLLHAELQLWKTASSVVNMTASMTSECLLDSLQGTFDDEFSPGDAMNDTANYAILESVNSSHNPMVNGLVSSRQSLSPLPQDQGYVNPILVQTDPNLQMTMEALGGPFGKEPSPMLWTGQMVKSELIEDNQSDEGLPIMRNSGVLSTSNYYPDGNRIKHNNRKWQAARMATENVGGITRMTDGMTSWGHRRGKRTICLWQFLGELLQNPEYQQWIRWLDRGKGIFKIEDSVRVAKLWGERKNRPAMNYDKLSRSIRQYYKKGIIQKTTNSKRLVYQFCSQYM